MVVTPRAKSGSGKQLDDGERQAELAHARHQWREEADHANAVARLELQGAERVGSEVGLVAGEEPRDVERGFSDDLAGRTFLEPGERVTQQDERSSHAVVGQPQRAELALHAGSLAIGGAPAPPRAGAARRRPARRVEGAPRRATCQSTR